MLYVYGDSHARFNMAGYPQPHVLLHTNSITMHRVGRDREILQCDPSVVQQSDTCLFFYGEVDCRCHIGRQLAYGRELHEIVKQLVESYLQTISHLFPAHPAHQLIIGSITPPVRKEAHEARHGPITHEFPMIGTDQERALFTQQMNEALRAACLTRHYVFLDLTSMYADEEGMLYLEKSDYNCHILENRAIHTAITRILSPVTVNIMGGLGNQLFQLAAAYSYAKKGTLRIHSTKNGSRPFYWDSICHAFLPYLVETLPSTLTVWHEPLPTMYTAIPSLPDGGIHLHGYFQTSLYHVDKEEIRSLFASPPLYVQSVQEAYHTLLAQSHRVIVVHCRQTDYLTHREIHGPLKMDYYRRAIEKARSWVEDPLFLLCGDDPSFWAPLCAELPSTTYHVLEEPSDVRTFLLLQQFRHVIMSNSTFIWWCVYLSSADHVIVPAKWFGPKGPSPFHDIYEATWIQMD
jgi:hypothetical protein